MFEKESEEYQIRKHHQRLYGHKPVVMKELNTTFKDGAEFGYHEGFKDCAKSRLNVTTISDCPGKDEVQLEYARAIIKDLLFNSDEYARQRAIDFLMENEQI